MKRKLHMLLQIIFRIPSPSIGRVPRFRDLWVDPNKEIAKLAKKGLEEGIKADKLSGVPDFETVARNFQEFAEVMSGRKEPDEFYATSGFKPKALICKNCGGQIDRKSGKCPFCDTEYDFEEESESYAYLYADDGLVEKIKLGGDTQ